MTRITHRIMVLTVALVLLLSSVPDSVSAVTHFGGAITRVTGCANDVIYAVIGKPRPGPYLWSPTATKTYSFGPPKHNGQWLLGNAGPSYFCIESILPVIVHPGLLMLIMGSSR